MIACGLDVVEGANSPNTPIQGTTGEHEEGPTGSNGASDDESSATESESGAETTSVGEVWECGESSECDDPSAPICLDGQCVPCGNASNSDQACADLEETQPFCNTDTGQCQACLANTDSESGPIEGRSFHLGCGIEAPICDDLTSSCRSCTRTADCLSLQGTACDPFSGMCLPDDSSMHVVVQVGDNFVNSIEDAFDIIRNNGNPYRYGTVLLHPRDSRYTEIPHERFDGFGNPVSIAIMPANLDNPIVIEAQGNGDDAVSLENSNVTLLLNELILTSTTTSNSNDEDALRTTASSHVFADSCQFVNSHDRGISVEDRSYVKLINSHVTNNGHGGSNDGGIQLTNEGLIDVVDTRLDDNDPYAIRVQDQARANVINSVIADTHDSDGAALRISEDATAVVFYSTLFSSANDANDATLQCSGPNALFVNSLIVSADDDDDVNCTEGTFRYSATEIAVNNDPSSDNAILGTFAPAWFGDSEAEPPDLSLASPPEKLYDTAHWNDSQTLWDEQFPTQPGALPRVDIAGELRDLTDSGAAGAFVDPNLELDP